MDDGQKLIIIGDGETAQIAFEYFSQDSPHEICGFAVEEKFRRKREMLGLPVISLEKIEQEFPCSDYSVFVAVSYTQLNRIRARLYCRVKESGYKVVSYISSKAFVWRTAGIGENCFILENNVIQHGVKIEDNVVLWSGNHIGHQSVIQEHVYIASHVVVSGFCRVGRSSFLGVNCCVNDNISIAPDCIVGSGAIVNQNTEIGRVYVGNPARLLPKDSYSTFKVNIS